MSYFRHEFVVRRRWLSDAQYTELVALCQFLPGPSSSQVGMAIGLQRGGWSGLLAAWAGFTLPSAFLLIGLAMSLTHLPALASTPILHGLKVAAVGIVAHAVWGMGRTLCPDRQRVAVAAMAAVLASSLPVAAGQLIALVLAAGIGYVGLSGIAAPLSPLPSYPVSRRQGHVAWALYVALLIVLPLWAFWSADQTAALLAGVYRAGALVFGGGHVVLPLLQSTAAPAGGIGEAAFLAGYSAAQAVPGPIFAFAAYLGAIAQGPLNGWTGGLTLLLVIFLPAGLILVAALPYWRSMRRHAWLARMLSGVNAAVVGLLLAALYNPIALSALGSWQDAAMAVIVFALLQGTRIAPYWIVLGAAAAGWALG